MTQLQHREAVTDQSQGADLPMIQADVPGSDMPWIIPEPDAGIASHDDARPSAMSPGKPIVFVVDDDTSTRGALEMLLGEAGWRPEIFRSAREFLGRERAIVPSCLVLDIGLPDLNGLDLQKHLAADRAAMPVIFITGHGDVAMAAQAMKAGAFDFLTKPFRGDALLGTVRLAIELSRTILDHEAELRALRDRYASLSRREREVMALIVSGLLNKQVGTELGISEITVKAHRGQVMRKMKAASFASLVKMALLFSPAAQG